MSSLDGKDPTRVAAGLKAAMHNPNVSSEAKENAAQRLEEIGGGAGGGDEQIVTVDTDEYEESGLSNRQAGGYKATLSNPNASSQAKRHAEELLGSGIGTAEVTSDGTNDLHQTRVNAGYKATLKNPNVSDEAKDHARDYHARDYLAENE